MKIKVFQYKNLSTITIDHITCKCVLILRFFQHTITIPVSKPIVIVIEEIYIAFKTDIYICGFNLSHLI